MAPRLDSVLFHHRDPFQVAFQRDRSARGAAGAVAHAGCEPSALSGSQRLGLGLKTGDLDPLWWLAGLKVVIRGCLGARDKLCAREGSGIHLGL